MDKLESVKARLCTWLSEDPDFILTKCGNMLLMNEFREAQKQSNALEKMEVLLSIIITKGDDTCHSFLDILKENQAHYKQLKQIFNPAPQKSAAPTAHADSCSVVTIREITDVKAETLNMEIKTEMDPRSWKTGTAVGPVLQGDYTALNGSVICADKISDVKIDVLNLSVSVKSVNTGRQDTATPSVDETLPSHQGPAAKMIISNKLRLIDCLSADPSFILQNVQQKNIVSNRQYGNLKDLSQREETIIKLIDLVIRKDEKACSLFLEVLKQPDILETYPNLNEIQW
ncbi:uncharacterized protein LOC117549532 [Gymnodraco acuticeps]|uniref:Uncharacterized protein LOC117549532 n=1 Tax=Gymnodraco acuticeps TaxID=8218 RepID=A0A6P8VLY6_GYMAC|nr:uncharacterized protein LOC117549532 [Gymnodraco acuticeps]XP_034077422.1 uncharacterized protein LOC117549532 [Gymnodraco acuticeps]